MTRRKSLRKPVSDSLSTRVVVVCRLCTVTCPWCTPDRATTSRVSSVRSQNWLPAVVVKWNTSVRMRGLSDTASTVMAPWGRCVPRRGVVGSSPGEVSPGGLGGGGGPPGGAPGGRLEDRGGFHASSGHQGELLEVVAVGGDAAVGPHRHL